MAKLKNGFCEAQFDGQDVFDFIIGALFEQKRRGFNLSF